MGHEAKRGERRPDKNTEFRRFCRRIGALPPFVFSGFTAEQKAAVLAAYPEAGDSEITIEACMKCVRPLESCTCLKLSK